MAYWVTCYVFHECGDEVPRLDIVGKNCISNDQVTAKFPFKSQHTEFVRTYISFEESNSMQLERWQETDNRVWICSNRNKINLSKVRFPLIKGFSSVSNSTKQMNIRRIEEVITNIKIECTRISFS